MASYERYNSAKQSRTAPENVDELEALLNTAKGIKNWDGDDNPATEKLKKTITETKRFGYNGDKFLLELIRNTGKKANGNPRLTGLWEDKPAQTDSNRVAADTQGLRGVGKLLLCWMLRDNELFEFFVSKPLANQRHLEKLPIHLAIEISNFDFLACFLGICHDRSLGSLRKKVHQVLEKKDRGSSSRNSIHKAMEHRIPFAPFMVAVCSADALKATDEFDYTPLHIALGQVNLVSEHIPEPPVSARSPKAPAWDNVFDPERVLKELLNRKDGSQKGKDDDQKSLIATILTTTSTDGGSPFQENFDEDRAKTDLGRTVKQLIFDEVKNISDMSKALFGTKGDVKELCLDMSDFNQSSHNFETFVNKMTQLDTGQAQSQNVLQFEDTLFFVHLPDLNYVKQPCPHDTIRRLFDWLAGKGVRTIKRLIIPDNTTSPLSDAFVQQYIIEPFDIEELDWRKLDVNIEIFASTNKTRTSDTCLTDLTLYSSGNWSVLYHWISEDGLSKLEGLSKVRIDIVHLNLADGYHDAPTHKRHHELASEYKSRIDKKHAENKSIAKYKYELEVKVDAKWDYPPPPHEPGEPTTQVLKHQFTGQLLPSLNALRGWEKLGGPDVRSVGRQEVGQESSSTKRHGAEEACESLFRKYALVHQPEDRRIKIAIIDNGADRIRSKFRHMIAKGQSFVNAGMPNSGRLLPWWMVSDPHGTQMAALIGQMNEYCRLYIARVGRSHSDIQPADAARAIDWAVEQRVDIISISWTLKQQDDKLKVAVERAAKMKTLIFCSTPDEGVYSEAWPVGWREHVLSVSATDSWGHMTTKTAGADPVDIQIPGENMHAAGPSYIATTPPTVSGSSVATALAAGIASLALLLLRTFNPNLSKRDRQSTEDSDDRGGRGEMDNFYTKEGIMRVFRQMGAPKTALQLSKLFPNESMDDYKILETLATKWNESNFPKLKTS